ARKGFPRLREPLQAIDGEFYLVKSDILAGTMVFSSSRDSMSNVVTLPVSRVKEILAMNKAGKRVDQLQREEDIEVKTEEPTYRTEEDSITRFDNARRKNRNNRNRPKGGNRPEGERENRELRESREPREPRGDRPERGERKERTPRPPRPPRENRGESQQSQPEGGEGQPRPNRNNRNRNRRPNRGQGGEGGNAEQRKPLQNDAPKGGDKQ
ncbi:MAG: hypothetical protein SNG60_08920, partial [Rikenellaceae bacterium]